MNLIEWTDELEVGVEEIDDEHRELIRMINEVFDGISNDGPGGAAPGLARLVAFTQHHFRTEEARMLESRYPRFEQHQREHIELTSQVLEIRQRMKGENSGRLTIELLAFLKSWLVDHIRRSDRAFGGYVRSCEKRAATAE